MVQRPLGPRAPGGGANPGPFDQQMKRGRARRGATGPPAFIHAQGSMGMGGSTVEVAQCQPEVGGRVQGDSALHGSEGSG
jgi:hypothetical protein